jgi:hypothetical protein
MNATPRTFKDAPAVRSRVPLLIGLMGPSGGGKTFSALRLATGVQSISGGDIFFLDTEARRALHYADQFKFRHIDFGEPFGSLDYLAAVRHSVRNGAGVVVIDSMSHEHSGPGGYLMTQDAELDRLAKADLDKRERMKFAAWIKPAGLRRQMIDGLLQLNANFIFCFRAKEKVKPIKIEGKMVPTEMGFMPIAGEEMLFEQTVNCLLLPRAGGVPTWRSDNVGEKLMMKLPGQFEPLFRESRPLDETIGRALAEWARGGTIAPPERAPAPTHGQAAETAAKKGTAAFRAFWAKLPKADRAPLTDRLNEFQRIAEQADAPRRTSLLDELPDSAVSPVAADATTEGSKPPRAGAVAAAADITSPPAESVAATSDSGGASAASGETAGGGNSEPPKVRPLR